LGKTSRKIVRIASQGRALLGNGINACLDRWVHPELNVMGRSRPAFHVCGGAGFVLASVVMAGLAFQSGLSLVILLVIIGEAVFAFLGLAMVTKVVAGEERLVFYHHEMAVLLLTSLLLRVLGEPALAYLDLTIVGIGIFLAWGRLGCLMVGCCHGRPMRWGVSYRREHREAGLAHYLVRVRLFPYSLQSRSGCSPR